MNEEQAEEAIELLNCVELKSSPLKTSLHFERDALVQVRFTDLFHIDNEILKKEKRTEDTKQAVDRLLTLIDSGVEHSLARSLSKEPYEGGQLWHIAVHVLYPLTRLCTLVSVRKQSRHLSLSAK
jgi:hypothetical protein